MRKTDTTVGLFVHFIVLKDMATDTSPVGTVDMRGRIIREIEDDGVKWALIQMFSALDGAKTKICCIPVLDLLTDDQFILYEDELAWHYAEGRSWAKSGRGLPEDEIMDIATKLVKSGAFSAGFED